ncbi:MAG: hypothetical protein UR60_C0007G0014 [Candidatus Moranbacteria bacterium GW2011_GWF2_34_56]|nr:MAG: hypothetical protein UR51_C0001G0014 [Candidatus Moranbacteria bacterium GW2011_GWF1_34_10]KKP65164.1 MAG: hypothetical protein UR60_C0007G0014 [Candidatus Moranbacteria bacterium GW2011_GWF2_34_56]HBI17390.1 hypothetical protein [Candidatus Moranbacteria bacterium]
MSDSNFKMFRLVDGNWVEYDLLFTGKIATSHVFTDEEIFNLYDNSISEETIINTIVDSAGKEIIIYRTVSAATPNPYITRIAGQFLRVGRHYSSKRVFLEEAADVSLDGKYKRPRSFGRGVMDYNENYTEVGIGYEEILGISYKGGAIFRGRLGDRFCQGKQFENLVDNPRINGCLIC